MKSFEQLLVEELGYQASSYGKWHVPERLAWDSQKKRRVISYNAFDFEKETFEFNNIMNWKRIYQDAAKYLLQADRVKLPYLKGQQENSELTAFSSASYVLENQQQSSLALCLFHVISVSSIHEAALLSNST